MDWVGLGWVGLDLRVGGGIEHLTVLINGRYFNILQLRYPQLEEVGWGVTNGLAAPNINRSSFLLLDINNINNKY